jgi:hypothetical protein
MSITQEQGADESTGSYSGQSPLVHSLSLGYSICLLINTVLSPNLSIMVVSPFPLSNLPYLGLGEGHPPRCQERQEGRKKERGKKRRQRR